MHDPASGIAKGFLLTIGVRLVLFMAFVVLMVFCKVFLAFPRL